MAQYNDFKVIVPGATGLQEEAVRDARDWYLGGTDKEGAVRDRPILMPDGHGWKKCRPTNDYQRVIDRDSNGCVSFASVDAEEYSANAMKATDPDMQAWLQKNSMIDENGSAKFNDRIVVVGSGTDPNAGNTQTAVAEFMRQNLLSPLSAWPWDNKMTRDQFYSGLTAEIIATGKPFGMRLAVEHEWLPNKPVIFSQTHTPEQLIEGLRRATPVISVDGNYEQDSNGLISARTPQPLSGKEGKQYYWNHRVKIEDYELGKYWVVKDHYTNQILQFAWDYPFGNGKLFFLKKKPMFQLIKEDGMDPAGKPLSAVYLFIAASGNYYAIGDSEEISGGDTLKTFSGTYGNAGIKHVPAGTIPKENVVGDFRARKF